MTELSGNSGELSEDRMSRRPERMPKRQHELVPFLALWATQYARDHGLDGIHPAHWDLMRKYGARMDDFKKASATP